MGWGRCKDEKLNDLYQESSTNDFKYPSLKSEKLFKIFHLDWNEDIWNEYCLG